MKNFLLRNIPEKLHSDWHYFSRRKGSTMRRYLLTALMSKIEADKEKAHGGTNDRRNHI